MALSLRLRFRLCSVLGFALQNLSFLQIVSASRFERFIVRFTFLDGLLSIVEVGLSPSHNLGLMPLHDDCRCFIQPNAEKLRIALHERRHVGLRFRCVKCWSMPTPGKKSRAQLISFAHHDERTGRCAPDKIISLNRGTCGTAADHSAAFENLTEKFVSLGSFVRIDEAPSSAAAKPNRFGLL